jgi:polyhydroxybutyrate depolymerase
MILIWLVGTLFVAACTSSSDKATPTKPSTTTTAGTPSTNRATTTTTAAPTCNLPHAPGQSEASFTFEGKERTYQLYVPPGYTGRSGVPVVFNFHGFGSNAAQQMTYGDFKPLADRHDFLIVAPDGQGDTGGRHFNLTGEPGLQNDLLMVSAALADVEAKLCVDTARVYSTGMSQGGAMTSLLACIAPDTFAAFAPVAVILHYSSCAGTHAVAITGFMGTADPIVPFDGGQVACCGGPVLPAAPAAMAGWAEHDHCDKEFTDTRLGSEVRRRTWSGCDPGSEAVFYIIDGGGHTWPGAISIGRLGLTTEQVDASNVIWDFFSKHRLES